MKKESNIKTPRGMTLDGSLMRRLSAALGDPPSVEVSDGGTVEDGLIELAIEKLTAAAKAEQAAWHAGIHEGSSQVQTAPAAVVVLNERFAFEVWAMNREDWRPSLERNGDGYKGGFAQEAWNGWKARAALYEKG